MIPVATIEDIAVEICRAVLVEQALPKVGPRGFITSWPNLTTENTHTPQMRPYRPLADEIDDMNLVFEKWFTVLSAEEKRLLYYRAKGIGWKKLCLLFGRSRSVLYTHEKNALHKVLAYAVSLQNQPTNQTRKGK